MIALIAEPPVGEFVEYVIEWEDGKEMFCEDFLQAGRAIRYRHRMIGFRAFTITAWYTGDDGNWNQLWDLEWTERDMQLTPEDYQSLRAQRVPLRLLDQMFTHPALSPEMFLEEGEIGGRKETANLR